MGWGVGGMEGGRVRLEFLSTCEYTCTHTHTHTHTRVGTSVQYGSEETYQSKRGIGEDSEPRMEHTLSYRHNVGIA